MSREQWGNGYWQGVRDAQNGSVRDPMRHTVLEAILIMCADNCSKSYSRSEFPVKQLRSYLNDDELTKRIWNYVLTADSDWFEEIDQRCYISGPSIDDWTKDSFMVPITHAEDWYWNKLDELRQMKEKQEAK